MAPLCSSDDNLLTITIWKKKKKWCRHTMIGESTKDVVYTTYINLQSSW